MALICNVKTESKWLEGQQYAIELTIYTTSATLAFNKTDILVKGDNLLFIDFERINPAVTPEPITEEGDIPQSTLNWAASFQGVAPIFAPWKIRITATGRPGVIGTDNKQLVITGKAFFQTNVSGTETFTKNVKIELSDPTGGANIPLKPKKFKATTVGANAINLTWAAVDQADEIEIERATNNNFTGSVSWRVGGSEVSYLDYKTEGIEPTVPALSPATKYFYRIRGIGTGDELGPDSDTDNATTIATPANPSAPTNVRGTAASGTEILVSFQEIADLVVSSGGNKITLKPSYQAFYSTVQGGPYTAYDVYRPTKDIKITGLLNFTKYYFVVKASYEYAPLAISANSSEATATTFNITGPPNAPGSPTATQVNLIQMRLAWTDTNAGMASYVILSGPSATGPFSPLVTLPPGSTSYTTLVVTGSTTVYFQIYAVNSFGSSPLST